MKSSSGLRIAVVASVCVQSFLACTNDRVDFTLPGGGGSGPRAGAGGSSAGLAGRTQAGAAGLGDDAGASGSPGDAGEAGAAGSGDAGTGNGGVSNGGQAGNAGRSGGGAGGAGGSAGRAGGGSGGAGSGGGGMSGGGSSGAPFGGAGSGGGGAAGSGGAVCGNQVLEKGEQCDDGNTKSLDACSASCAFEQSQRATSIEQRAKPSSFCSKNAFGAAFQGVGQTALQAVLDQRVANGSLSLLFAFRGLRDLTGSSTETITLGMAYGVPSVAPNYDGTSDLDWWYKPAEGQVEDGVLYSSSTAHLADGVLDAEADSLRLPLFSEVPVYISNIKVRLSLGDSSTPLTSTGVAPGHLASEHVRPTLVSFASGGSPTPGSTDLGQLCGGLSAASLSGVAIPATYATTGATPCAEGYGPSRTFLELLVGGCTVHGEELVSATQPDQADPGAPAVGAGAPYRLVSNVLSHAVTACRDRLNAPVGLAACLNAAAYSSAYRVKIGRVIIK